jgi:phage shock protein PspC (stress-responsive transcriptional regulator)
MKKTININFQGQLITIEETAYHLLNQYIVSLKVYFGRDAEGNEIVNDIENRIAELFGNRLKHGIPCITDDDVTVIIDTIGRVEDFDEIDEEPALPPPHPKGSTMTPPLPTVDDEPRKKLYRKTNDKILGGVCSGLAHYLKVDPVFVRLGFVFLSSLLFWVYIIMWIVLLGKELPNNVSKRLYRNPNDRFIGGVCGGIAAYFRIDTWIPRLIFLLPLLFNMLGLVRIPLNLFSHTMFSSSFPFNFTSSVNLSLAGIYIILWIIVPKAVTVKQKLEMMGEEEYLRTIRETMNDNVAHSRSSRVNAAASATVSDPVKPVESITVVDDSIDKQTDTENINNATAQGAIPPPPPPHTSYASAQPQRSGCLSFLIGMVKVAFFAIVGIIVAGFMISLFTLIFTGAKLVPLQSLFIDAGFEHTLLWVSIILTLLIPFVGVIIWIVRRVMKSKSRPAIGFVVAALWFVGIVAGLTLGFNITRKFSIDSLQETNIELTTPTTNKLYIDMARYSSDYFSVTPGTSNFIIGPHRFGEDEINTLPFYNVDEDSLLFNNIDLRIKTSKDTLFHVKTIYSSFERNYKSAKANLKEFDFTLEQNDSVLWIPQFFKTPKEQGYRKQFVVVEIYVPSGYKLEVSDELEDYQQRISSDAMRRRYGRDYGYRNSLEWNSNEEYLLEDETLTETSLLNDTI